MLFNKATTIQLIKRSLSTSEKKDTAGIEIALGAAIDDLAKRTRSSRFLRSYDLSVAATLREKEVNGNNEDLAHIFALKLGTGVNQRTLEWVDPQSFLRDLDSPTVSAGLPQKYTILTYSSEGWPIVRFDRPLGGTETMKVLYYIEVTGDAPVPMPATVLVQGTLAYFWGTGRQEPGRDGFMAYERFKEAARIERASASMNPEAGRRFRLNRDDRAIMGIQQVIRSRRRPA